MRINKQAAIMWEVLKPGKIIHLSDLFPEKIAEFIIDGLDTKDGQEARQFNFKGKNITLRLRRLRKKIDDAKGLVIINE